MVAAHGTLAIWGIGAHYAAPVLDPYDPAAPGHIWALATHGLDPAPTFTEEAPSPVSPPIAQPPPAAHRHRPPWQL